jgi:hypothetical protein
MSDKEIDKFSASTRRYPHLVSFLLKKSESIQHSWHEIDLSLLEECYHTSVLGFDKVMDLMSIERYSLFYEALGDPFTRGSPSVGLPYESRLERYSL